MNDIQLTTGAMITLEDYEAILATCRDYAEGWYSGDVERMQRSLHPEMVKRSVTFDEADGGWHVGPVRSREDMVRWTMEGGGKDVPGPRRESVYTVLDAYRRTASAVAYSHEYVDYLHLAKFEEGWKIVNALWEYLEER